MKIAFIIVTYKTPVNMLGCLESEIEKMRLKQYKIFITDNTVTNRGYAKAVNEVIQNNPSFDLYIVMNPDISIATIQPENLREAYEKFDVWGYSMLQNNTHYYGGIIDPFRMCGGLDTKKPSDRYIERDFVSGSFMCIKRNVIKKIGILDESFFMYYEDTDFCLRAKKAGFKVGIDTHNTYTHFEKSDNNPNKKMFLSINRFRFLLRYGKLKHFLYEIVRLPKTIIEDRKQIFQYVTSNKFLIGFFSLNTSSFINKLLNFFLFIFLIKYLTVEQYGIYTLVWAQTTLFSPLVDLGTTSYGLLYLDKDIHRRFTSLFNLRIILSIIVFIITVISSFFTLSLNLQLVFFTFLISFTLLSNMMSGSLLILFSTKGKLHISSIVSIIFNCILIGMLIIALIVKTPLAIFFSIIGLSYLIYALFNYILQRNEIGSTAFYFDIQEWKKIIGKSYVFVLIGIFANIYFKIDVFLLNYIKGQETVAVYSAGYKFLEALMFVVASYNIASTPLLSKLAGNNLMLFKEKIKKDILFVFSIGALIVLLTLFFGQIFLPLILKGVYKDSILIAQIVIFALPLMLVSSVFLNSLYALGKAKLVIFIFLTTAIFNSLANILFIPYYSYFASAVITITSEIILIILSVLLLRSIFKFQNKQNENLS